MSKTLLHRLRSQSEIIRDTTQLGQPIFSQYTSAYLSPTRPIEQQLANCNLPDFSSEKQAPGTRRYLQTIRMSPESPPGMYRACIRAQKDPASCNLSPISAPKINGLQTEVGNCNLRKRILATGRKEA